jgi:hypothetical protein
MGNETAATKATAAVLEQTGLESRPTIGRR